MWISNCEVKFASANAVVWSLIFSCCGDLRKGRWLSSIFLVLAKKRVARTSLEIEANWIALTSKAVRPLIWNFLGVNVCSRTVWSFRGTSSPSFLLHRRRGLGKPNKCLVGEIFYWSFPGMTLVKGESEQDWTYFIHSGLQPVDLEDYLVWFISSCLLRTN